MDIPTDYIRETYDAYCTVRQELGRGEKPMTLMDLATIAAKKLKADGKLNDLDESEEINACSIHVPGQVDGSRTKPTTTPPRSSRSAVLRPVWAVRSVTRCRDVPTYIRQCVSPVQPIRWCR